MNDSVSAITDARMPSIDDNNCSRSINGGGEPKLLVHRYKLPFRHRLNKYASFSNAIQYPGLVNIAAHNASMGKTPRNLTQNPPTIYDYFGYGISNLLNVNTDPKSRLNNFDIINPLDNKSCSGRKSIFRQEETRPRFFFIESRLTIQSRKNNGNTHVANYSFDDEHYVAVVYKDGYYYICPGEENSLIYRVGCPDRLFLTEEGHAILSVILRNALGTDFGLNSFRLVIPKQHLNYSLNNGSHWDRTSKYQIELYIPFPVYMSRTMSEDCHSTVQVVTLKDDDDDDYTCNVVDILIEGDSEDELEDESEDEELI